MSDYPQPDPTPPPLPVFNPINWPQIMEQGGAGFQGTQGFQGIGIGGSAGTQGFQGFIGFQGIQGNEGFQGWQGFEGNQGNQGFQGTPPLSNLLFTQTYGATTTFDIDTNGTLQRVVLTASATFAITLSSNRTFVLLVEQGGVGSYTVSWFSTIKWAGGTPPTLTTTVGKTDAFGFIRTSAGNYLGYVVGLNA